MVHTTLHGHSRKFVEKGRSEFIKEGQREFNTSYADKMLEVARDAWTPEWVKLVLGNGAVIKCSFEFDYPYLIDCNPEGKVCFCFDPKFERYRVGLGIDGRRIGMRGQELRLGGWSLGPK